MDDRDALWKNGRDESVEVNQRALIDKVLARYSGEFTVFRELLQNADDAGAQRAEIHFHSTKFTKHAAAGDATNATDRPLPDLKTEPLGTWTFKNDGTPFRQEDWNRLKKIAEGNPDEQKIGAFGVGFYSLFSVTEKPFVTSGSYWMAFYWKDGKDQLFVRRGDLNTPSDRPEGSSPSGNPWTTFEMELRDPAPLPGRPIDMARFLATSLTFMSHICEVSMFFDNHRLVHLVKDVGVPKELGVPRSLKNITPQGLMAVKGITSTSMNIKASTLRWVYTTGTEKPPPKISVAAILPQSNTFFSSFWSSFKPTAAPPTPEPPPPPLLPEVDNNLDVVESSVRLTIFTATVDVTLSKMMTKELERETKKKPPSRCAYQLVYTGKDEYDASRKEDEEHFHSTGSVFQGLRADLDGARVARVFIGHATSQTTGIGGHVAARFIPTVERESMDLVDKTISVWNKELLSVGGFLSRAIYEFELANIQALWVNDDTESALATRKWLIGKCLHTLQFFTFHASTPSPVVSQHTEAAFFNCAKDSTSFPIVSSIGVVPAKRVRYPDPAFSGFLKNVSVVPDEITTGARAITQSLRQRGLVMDVTFKDVINELNSRSLNEDEMVACLKWRLGLSPEVVRKQSEVIRELVKAAAFFIPATEGKPERAVSLGSISTFIDPKGYIPVKAPLPVTTLPFSVSKNLGNTPALKVAFGWTELGLVSWVAFLVAPNSQASLLPEETITLSSVFAEHVLGIVAKAWSTLGVKDQESLVYILKNQACVPTVAGMKTPDESYLPNVSVFPDLPVVTMPKGSVIKGPLEKLLLALGTRKHAELQLVFTRNMASGSWSIVKLVQYLVSVKDSLTNEEFEKLRQTAVFHRKEAPLPMIPQTDAKEAAKSPVPPQTVKRYTARELYEPTDVHESLGLPILDWQSEKWRTHSVEAKFLSSLGLQKSPSLRDILVLAASPTPKTRETALRYFLDQYVSLYAPTYNPANFATLAFVPAVKPDGSKFMATPSEIFTDPSSAMLGFSVVDPSLQDEAQTKLRLVRYPPTSQLMPILLQPPLPRDPKQCFEYFTSRIADFTDSQIRQLHDAPFVPVKYGLSDELKGSTNLGSKFVKPSECYKGKPATTLHSKLFTFVDFGSTANIFLARCGTKEEPTSQEIAQMLISNPRKFYETAGGPHPYLAELTRIASSYGAITRQTQLQMRKVPLLLGSRRAVDDVSTDPASAHSDEKREPEYQLLLPSQVVIVDDTSAFRIFRDHVWAAPQEDSVEKFYEALGAKRLSILVHEDFRAEGVGKNAKLASTTRTLVLERLPLFLYEQRAPAKSFKFDWFSQDDNFQVKTVGKLDIISTLVLDGNKVTKTRAFSASAQRNGRGPVILYLAENTKLDLYDVARCICKIVFEQHRANDSMLFGTVLASDLEFLKHQGYNVDRILNQQRADRIAREEKIKAQQAEAMKQAKQISESSVHPRNTLAAEPFHQDTPSTGSNTLAPPALGSDLASKISSGLMNTWKQKLQRTPQPSGSASAPVPAPSESKHLPPTPASETALDRPSFPGSFPGLSSSTPFGKFGAPKTQTTLPNPRAQATPTRDIERNIQMAIAACREERSDRVQNRAEMMTVKETLNDGYCDVTGGGDISHIGSVAGYRIFVATAIPNAGTILAEKLEALTRFGQIVIDPLRHIYKVPPRSIAIFYDLEGPLIAFNRGGSIFFNLRYYEAWHDGMVQAGDYQKARISWYFVLAHELAHNLVQPHNSEHEFYFSSLCEGFLLQLCTVLAA